jgi:hypothetical protein
MEFTDDELFIAVCGLNALLNDLQTQDPLDTKAVGEAMALRERFDQGELVDMTSPNLPGDHQSETPEEINREELGWAAWTVRKWIKNGCFTCDADVLQAIHEEEQSLPDAQVVEPGEIVDRVNTTGAIRGRLMFLRRFLSSGLNSGTWIVNGIDYSGTATEGRDGSS